MLHVLSEAVSVVFSMHTQHSLNSDAISWKTAIVIAESLLHANHVSCENQGRIHDTRQH